MVIKHIAEYLRKKYNITENTAWDKSSHLRFNHKNCAYDLTIEGAVCYITIGLNLYHYLMVTSDISLHDPQLFPKIDCLMDFGSYFDCLNSSLKNLGSKHIEKIVGNLLPLLSPRFIWY